MIFYVLYTDDGVIQQVGALPEGAPLPVQSGLRYLATSELVDPDVFCIKNKKLVARPPKPGIYYTWNSKGFKWILDIEGVLSSVRRTRNQLLSASDWSQLGDVNLSLGQKKKWGDYRQALRDITEQEDPLNIIWPPIPS